MMHGSLSSSKRGDDSPASKPPPARGFCINGVLDPFPCLRYRLRMPDADDKLTPVNLLHHGRRRSTAMSVEPPSEISERRYRPRTFRPHRAALTSASILAPSAAPQWSGPRRRGHPLSLKVTDRSTATEGHGSADRRYSSIRDNVDGSIGGNRNTILPSDDSVHKVFGSILGRSPSPPK